MMQIIQVYEPKSTVLKEFLYGYAFYQNTSNKPVIVRYLPNNMDFLIVNNHHCSFDFFQYKQQESFPVWLSTKCSNIKTIILFPNAKMVSMRFKPFAMKMFFDLTEESYKNDSSIVLTNLSTKLDMEIIYNNIINISDINYNIKFIENFLLLHLKEYSQEKITCFSKLINYIYQTQGRISVQELSSMAGLSHHQLIRRFKELTGRTPKQFIDIVKFQHASCSIKNYGLRFFYNNDASYYDQSHFINFFKKFSNLTPTEYQQKIQDLHINEQQKDLESTLLYI